MPGLISLGTDFTQTAQNMQGQAVSLEQKRNNERDMLKGAERQQGLSSTVQGLAAGGQAGFALGGPVGAGVGALIGGLAGLGASKIF